MEQCLIKDCKKESFARGYCRMHYARWWKHGNPNIVRVRGLGKLAKNIGNCIIEGCQNPQEIKHFCNKHYRRFLKWGDPNQVKKSKGRDIRGNKNPNWKGGIAEYPDHCRMKRLRLQKLKEENSRCQMCGGKAVEIHHRNGNKADQRIKNYMALCHSCHKKTHGYTLHQDRKEVTSDGKSQNSQGS